MKLFVLSFTLIVLAMVPMQAQASSWLKCDVVAKVLEIGDTNYKVKIKSGEVTDGHAKTGSKCLVKGAVYDVELAEGDELEKGDKIDLLYEYYSGRGPDGPVEVTTWKLSPQT